MVATRMVSEPPTAKSLKVKIKLAAKSKGLTSRDAPTVHKLFNFISFSFQSR